MFDWALVSMSDPSSVYAVYATKTGPALLCHASVPGGGMQYMSRIKT